jgi:cytochrome c oxidase cbb3-type subunit 3
MNKIMNKIILTTVLLAVSATAMAQPTEGVVDVSMYQVMMGLIFVMLAFVLLLLAFTLKKVIDVLKKEALGESYEVASVEEQTTWEKLLSLKPLSSEKEVELDHDFDGIKELNNPIPFWFNLLFYGTIVIGIIYLLVYHVFNAAPLQTQEYKIAMEEAEKSKQEYVKKAGNLIDESNVVMLTDASKIEAGAQVFLAKCAVCHGEKGEGKVGPNLADAYWIHGGDIQSIFKTIKYGVPAKGMVAWQNSMNGGQMQELASYIITLQGTNPPGAKEPQGVLAAGTPTPADSIATTTDSTVTN